MQPISVRQAILSDLDELAQLFDDYRQFQGQTSDIAAARDFLRARFNHGESVIFICLIASVRSAVAQTPPLQVVDARNLPLTALVDGNSISLQINLTVAVSRSTPVDFLLDGLAVPLAACTIPAEQTSCQTALFPAFGWAWAGAGGQSQRVVQALSAGLPLGESAPLAIIPRPVVMVHGFTATWEGWGVYLGADGYLAASGLHGYAVGDGQVPGVMDTGNKAAPLLRTNTIAQNAEILGEYIRNVQPHQQEGQPRRQPYQPAAQQ